MDVRQLLQAEIWSKRTTRKVLTVTGFVFGFLLLGFFVWHEVGESWVTPGERSAAKAALVEIDALQNAESMNGKEFDSEEEKAQLKFDAARSSIRTHRDEDVVVLLSTYLILTTSPWDDARFALEYPGSSIDGDPKSVLKSWNSSSESRKQLRTLLHKELD